MSFAAAVTRTVTRTAARTVARTAAGVLGLVAAGCVTGPTAREPELPPHLARLSSQFRHDHVAPSRSTPSEIGSDLLSLNPNLSLYDLVQRQWPYALRPLPTPSAPRDPAGDVLGVYSKTAWLGGQDVLRTVPAAHVLAAYRLTPAQEFARFGRQHAGGAVEIVWRPGGR